MMRLLLLLLSLFHSHATNYTRMVDHASESVVRITAVEDGGQSICTGFVIAVHRVLTANHCVGKQMQADGQAVKLLKVDPYYDLALLDVKTDKAPLKFNTVDVWRFESLTAIGYGYGWKFLTALSGPVVLVAQAPSDDAPPGIIVQADYIHGMSGGPVVDANGEVVGIAQQTANGTGYGVSTLLIQAFLLGT